MIKNHKKTIMMLVFIVFFTNINFNVTFAYTPKDVQLASDYAKESIVVLSNKNIISGDENGNYNPKKRVSRGELVTMIVRALDIDTSNSPDVPTFKDVSKNHWAYKYVEAAYKEGIIKGVTTDYFNISSQCTREEMATIIMRSLKLSENSIAGKQKIMYINKFKDKESISEWAKDAIELAIYTKLMNGTSFSTFTPKGYATREQVAVIIDRILSSKAKLESLEDRIKLISMPQVAHLGINTANVENSLGIGLYFIFATPLENFRLNRLDVYTNDGKSHRAQTNINYTGKNKFDKMFHYEFDNMSLQKDYEIYYEAEIRTEFGLKTFEMKKDFKIPSNSLSLFYVDQRAQNELEVKVNADPEENSMKNIKNYEVLDQDGRKIEILNIENVEENDSVILTLEKNIPKGYVITVKINNIRLKEDTTKTFGPSSISILGGYSISKDFNEKEHNEIVNKVDNKYKINKDVEIIFNGDKVSFNYNPIVENNIVLVPLEFFDKYIVGNFYSSYFEKNDIVYLETPPNYHRSKIYDVSLKPGINRAYKNINSNPFDNEETYKDNQILLEIAPKISNGIVFLPLKDLCNILQIEYYYDQNENRIYLRDDRINKHPSLYYAVRKNFYFPYIGNAEVEGKILLKEKYSGDYLQVEYENFSKINKTDGHLWANYKIEENNKEVRNLKYEEIVLKDKYYTKDFENNKWIEHDREYAKRELGGILIDELQESYAAYEVVVNSNFYQDYGKLPIKKIGSVEVDGVPAVKYVIQLDAEEIKAVIPKDDYYEKKEIIEKIFKGRIGYTIELYLRNEEIVKEVFKFYGEASDPENQNNVEIYIDIETDFKNIGSEIKIMPPDKILIKP